MRVGVVLAKPPGYSETFFNSKIKGLQKQGYTVTVYAANVASNFNLCNVVKAPKVSKIFLFFVLQVLKQFLQLTPYFLRVLKYWKLERKQGVSSTIVFKKIYLNAHLLRANADWLHFGFATVALGSENIAQCIGAKMAVSFRGFDINVYPLKHPDCYKLLWAKVDKVHSISEYLYKKALGLGLSSNVQFQIITPATNIATNKAQKWEATAPIILVTVARLTWIKGLDVAIEAMRLLREKGLAIEYRIIGDGTQKEKERYAFQAFEAGLKDDILFMGALSHAETLREIANGALYIQPSLNEGFCNAVLEAQALGKLVIASNIGGLPENVKNNVTGFLYTCGNAQNLQKVISNVLELPSTEKQKIAEAAIKRVKSTFIIDQQEAAFAKFYTEIL